jgi:hypothetical protein
MKQQGFSYCPIRCPCFPCINFSPCLPCENISTSEVTFFFFFLSLFLLPLFVACLQPSSEPSERLGLSDDVGAGFISGHSSQPAPSSELNVDRSVELPAQDEIGSMGASKVIRADQKRFFFDLGSNNRGHFLRISEVCLQKTSLTEPIELLFV